MDTITVTVQDSISAQVIDTLRMAAPPVNTDLAAAELFGREVLSDLEKRYLDLDGNQDGVYNLGDFIALLDRLGIVPSPKVLQQVRARSVLVRGAINKPVRRRPGDSIR